MTHTDGALKLAYRAGAAIAANEAGIIKNAGLWGKLLGGLGKLFPTEALNAPAQRLAGTVGKHISPAAGHYTSYLGKGLAPSMVGGGLFDSAVSAAMAPEGQGWEAARDAFLPGALGWGAWHLGARGANLALNRGARAMAGAEGAKALRMRQKTPWFDSGRNTRAGIHAGMKERKVAPMSDRAIKSHRGVTMKPDQTGSIFRQLKTPGERMEGLKNIGAKAYGSALPFGAAWYASGAVGDALHPEPPPVPYPAMYEMGRGAWRGYRGTGLTPYDNYNYGQY